MRQGTGKAARLRYVLMLLGLKSINVPDVAYDLNSLHVSHCQLYATAGIRTAMHPGAQTSLDKNVQ
jgi:hypothetical protein